MKPSVFPHMVAVLVLGSLTPLSAQNLTNSATVTPVVSKSDPLESESRFEEGIALPDGAQLPALQRAAATLPEAKPVYGRQDAATLDSRSATPQKVDAVVNLNVLQPSALRKVGVSGNLPTDPALENGLAKLSAMYREAGAAVDAQSCGTVALSVEQRVKLDVSKVLEVVDTEVRANPACSCEIVKTAIKASDADVTHVVSIVETAITASPESMRIISQCAIATMPESVSAVQALLAKLDPNSGEDVYSAKSAKSAKTARVAAIEGMPPLPNPLDLIPTYPLLPPPLIPPPVTRVNP